MPPNEQGQGDTYDDIERVVERGNDALSKKWEQADLHEISAHRHKTGSNDSPSADNSHIRHVHRPILPELGLICYRLDSDRVRHRDKSGLDGLGQRGAFLLRLGGNGVTVKLSRIILQR